ncbi:uncharacterized protein K452DRAFT_65602 [Aplosporella prunicola CBS 121167]|uniref:Uncharacterized protein n=1 Tax=Aplosporella prunicola CBS 121167 TaxID=1176127 RepID=A0A6A6BQZ4_9PEZI|nr:uncharacterized protein K452DRAFT_65602 [Aplosporella prunicola CBS 121167]KAF2146430.1 hypothetical protein K452DRAFT_65602 [Aplosporella prunicola CBS 121167]
MSLVIRLARSCSLVGRWKQGGKKGMRPPPAHAAVYRLVRPPLLRLRAELTTGPSSLTKLTVQCVSVQHFRIVAFHMAEVPFSRSLFFKKLGVYGFATTTTTTTTTTTSPPRKDASVACCAGTLTRESNVARRRMTYVRQVHSVACRAGRLYHQGSRKKT